jgi:hypothetical protein
MPNGPWLLLTGHGRAFAVKYGIPASFRARVIRAALCPASRWANIHRRPLRGQRERLRELRER